MSGEDTDERNKNMEYYVLFNMSDLSENSWQIFVNPGKKWKRGGMGEGKNLT